MSPPSATEARLLGAALGLPPQRAAIVLMLARSPRPLSREQLLEGLDALSGDYPRVGNQVSVVICMVRRQLGRDAIVSSPGRPTFYSLSGALRARVEALTNPARAA